jgi:hypothetical protein
MLTEALAREPENTLSHANQGWALLHGGDHRQALTHFREALRLDPMQDWARAGIVEALKARNPVYRLLLRYWLWMSRLTDEEQWETVAILASGWRALRAIARAVPLLYAVVFPLSLVYRFFSVLTWTARPLFALTLRFDWLGRLALPREEYRASNWIAACLLVAGGGTILSLVLQNAACLVVVAVALAMILPISGVFRCRAGWGRVVLVAYSALLALVGLAASALACVGGWALLPAVVLGIVFTVGWTSYTWIASLIVLTSAASTR